MKGEERVAIGGLLHGKGKIERLPRGCQGDGRSKVLDPRRFARSQNQRDRGIDIADHRKTDLIALAFFQR